MPQSWNMEWLNSNAERAFPFKEDVSLRDDNQVIRVPNRLIVDLVFVVPAGTSYRYYLKSLMYSGTHINLVMADEAGETVSSVTVALANHSRNAAYTMSGEGNFSGAVGRIALGDLGNLTNDLPPGVYSFTLDTAEFELRTVRPDLRAVHSLSAISADGTVTDDITGIVQLIAGSNVRLTYVAPVDGNPAGIRIDATGNADYEEDCGCDSKVIPLDPIRSINGVGANPSSGRLDLVSMTPCLTISVSGDSVVLTDNCSQPCCGCPELEFLTERLKLLDDTVAKIETFQAELDERERLFYQGVLASLK
jgi:hypothetical protein